MQRRVRLVDLVTARDSISPNITELIEVIDTPASDENQIVDIHGPLQKSANFPSEITNESRLRSKGLRNKRPFLAGFHPIEKKSGGERQPRGRPQIVLIIDRRSLEECAGRSDKSRAGNESVLVRIIDLSLLIVIDDELVLPPIVDSKIDMWRDEPLLGQKMIDRFWVKDRVWISGLAFRIHEQTTDARLFVRRKTDIGDSRGIPIIVVWASVIGIEPAGTN